MGAKSFFILSLLFSMDLYQIYLAILDKPDAPKFYRELKNCYASFSMDHEGSVIAHLIEKKFAKNAVTNDPSGDQE